MNRVFGILAVLFVGPGTAAHAQETSWIKIDTNLPEGLVYADSLRLGRAERGLFAVRPGTETIRLVPPNAGSWSVAPVETQVHLSPGDTVQVVLAMPYYYRIESLPFGSSVYLESDSSRSAAFGETPVLIEAEEPITERLIVAREGYHSHTITPGQDVWNVHSVALEPVRLRPETTAAMEVEWRPPGRRGSGWIDYAALGVGAVAGVLAIHYKFKADRLFERYQETGDASLRDTIVRYDRQSGAALIAMQAGITVFTVRLILR